MSAIKDNLNIQKKNTVVCLVSLVQTRNQGQKNNRGNSAALRIQTMPTKHDTQHSGQHYEHMKHQEKFGLH